MLARIRIILMGLVLPICASSMFAAHTDGWVDDACGYQTFHISDVTGLPVGQALVVTVVGAPVDLGTRMTFSDWWDARAESCSRDGKCEVSTQAKIRLNDTSGRNGKIKEASGKYSIDFGSKHFEGQFLVKYARIKPPPRCE